VDGDGKADLVWRNTNSGDVVIWLLNGTTIASTGIVDRLPTQWEIALVSDADGDGKVDVIWRDTNTGTVVLWLLNGPSVSSDGSPGTTSTDWIIAGRPSPSLPNPPTTVSLNILTSGKGSGSITCNGATCNPTYPSGTALTLLAIPEDTSLFGGWSGACAAAGTAHTCNFTIKANTNVTASFNLLILSVVLAGSGTVTSNPAGIECGSTCSASFNKGTSVTLTATGAGFSGWTGGGCAGNGTCVFTVNQNTTITATFNHSGLPCPVEPVLVKDINPGATSFSTSGNSLVNVNGVLFFRANDGAHGFELWKSDGTEAGTVLVKDINPGTDSAFSSLLTDSFVAVNNMLFFTANDGVNGVEIWKSDGSEAGTVMVKDIRAGPKGSAPAELTDVNGTLFFVAGDGTNGLWKSDGTEGGTIKIATFNFYPEWLTNVNGTLFFSAFHSSYGGVELWKSDGTIAGTELVRNLNGVSNSWPRWLTNVNGTLFFTAVDFIPITGSFNGLFKSDGTSAGTVLVKEVSSAVDLTRVGNKLYFRALNTSVGYQPYISDGTTAGTRALKPDLFLNSLASEGPWFTDVNGIAFFSANDGITGTELWKSDGTEAGTVLVKDILPGGNSAPQSLINVDGTLFFIAGSSPGSPGVGRELWLACGM
ncbi:MAG: hypothetical protein KC587_13885, partial [Nitrospira sp.]|nr:hypothetical protein [Nitrospira sp.]